MLQSTCDVLTHRRSLNQCTGKFTTAGVVLSSLSLSSVLQYSKRDRRSMRHVDPRYQQLLRPVDAFDAM